MIDNNNFKKNLSNGNIPETLNERLLVASEGNYCNTNIKLFELKFNSFLLFFKMMCLQLEVVALAHLIVTVKV